MLDAFGCRVLRGGQGAEPRKQKRVIFMQKPCDELVLEVQRREGGWEKSQVTSWIKTKEDLFRYAASLGRLKGVAHCNVTAVRIRPT